MCKAEEPYEQNKGSERDKGSKDKNAGCGELLPQFKHSTTLRAPHKQMNARDPANESKAFDVYRSALLLIIYSSINQRPFHFYTKNDIEIMQFNLGLHDCDKNHF